MLILERRVGESITIGSDIEIMLLRNNNGLISLGFNAPKDIRIMRNEILHRYPKVGPVSSIEVRLPNFMKRRDRNASKS